MQHRLALSVAFLCCAAGAQAAGPTDASVMSRDSIRVQQRHIEAEYDAGQARCRSLERAARGVCNEKARGARDVAAAELQMELKPTAENDEKVRMAKAEAVYAVALETCKGMDGSARDVCRGDAKAVFAAARSEARLQKEVVAQGLQAQRIVRERNEVSNRQAQAQFKAERERCDALAPESRQACVDEARRRFEQL